jgi:tetratricopeptide (TPR) repeat protein/ferredoxin
MVVDPGCMKCGDCVSVCPNDALYFGWGTLPALARSRGPEPATRRYPLTWGEELFAAGAFVVAFFSFRGLFGYVPFLMALGLAGCIAFVALVAWRVTRRPSYAFRHRELKRSGRLSGAGRLWLAGVALLAALTAGAAFLQLELRRAESDYRRIAGLRGRAVDATIDPGSPAAAPGPAESAALDRAARRFERIASLSPVAWLGLDARLAWTRHLRGDRAGFAAASARAVERGDSVSELLHLRAIEAADRGDAPVALAALEGLSDRGIAGDAQWVAVATRAGRGGRLGAADAVLEAARSRFPDSVAVRYNSAVVSAVQNQPEKAAARFREVLAIDPEHREARENLAGMLAASGRYSEAAELYRDAIARMPGDVELRLLRARALGGAGRREEALAEVRAVLELSPSSAEAAALLEELSKPQGS